jgi:HNH endonuclease
MSVTYIPSQMRRDVIARAKKCCEYCRIHEDDTGFGCEVDHILSEKHGGETTIDNLSYACFFCNRNKGSDLGSVRSSSDYVLIRFFHPRLDTWDEHFSLSETMHIEPLTDIGLVTSRILGFNAENRVLERIALALQNRYPRDVD